MNWDVFICHASEDKPEIAAPLAQSLAAVGCRVWYDEFVLRVGDSLRRTIDRGLAETRYGVVILSHAFFAKNWPQAELDGLLTREHDGQKVILPVLHGLDLADCRSYSPMMAGRLTVSSADGLPHVASEILKVVFGPEREPPGHRSVVEDSMLAGINRLRAQRTLTPGEVVRESRTGLEVVRVSGGLFVMGSRDGDADEREPHARDVADFFIGRYPVTIEQWWTFVRETGYKSRGQNYYGCPGRMGDSEYSRPVTSDCPVTCVSYQGAKAFAAWLSDVSGQRYRLPTEAEWEYAARDEGRPEFLARFAGCSSDADLSDFAWYKANSEGGVHPVGLKKPNSLGLFDMSGNVYEWCEDRYAPYPSEGRAIVARLDGPILVDRVIRGGSWFYDGPHLRCTNREDFAEDHLSCSVGFRLARDP